MRVSCYGTKTGVPYKHKEKTKRTKLYSIFINGLVVALIPTSMLSLTQAQRERQQE